MIEKELVIEKTQLVLLEGGRFKFGDIWGDGDKDEYPIQELEMSSFYAGKYCVSLGEFVGFLNEIPADSQGLIDEYIDLDAFSCITRNKEHFSIDKADAMQPVTSVSWTGANAYCGWLSQKENVQFRLLSEAEWQFAAMGSNNTKWAFGNDFDPSKYVFGKSKPENVDCGTPQENGLYNMTGNIFEWVNDEYGFTLNQSESDAIKEHRVIKGGSFILSEKNNLRNSKRFSCHEKSCLKSNGFRIGANYEPHLKQK
ncbi:MAG: SUMF1/EgtB/PvdO family nonheme iron enzyme [Crocinitomix sp.]|nr:SUMF1/EgtB/PvdO family nonheme iron enzyme [Crocinitomix sp.]